MKTIQPSALLMFLLLLLCPLFAADQLYTIKMKRAFLPGSRYGITVLAKENMNMTITAASDGSILKQNIDEKHISLEALAQVLEVSPTGTVTSCLYTIKKFNDLTKGVDSSILPRDTRVNARLEEKKTVFYINDKPVEEKMGAQLSAVIHLDSENENADALYGTDKKVKIGEPWNINTAKVTANLRNDSLHIDEKDLEGNAFIRTILQKSGLDCLEIICEMNIKYLNFSFPETINIEHSSARIYSSSIYPVDLNRNCMEDLLQMSYSMNAAGKWNEEYPDVKINASAAMSKKTEYSY